MNVKKCSKCDEVLPLSDFYVRAGAKYYHSACKACERVMAKSWYNKNRESAKAKVKKWREKNSAYVKKYRSDNRRKNYKQEVVRKYGVEPSWFDEQMRLQGNACAICKREFEWGNKQATPHVDHCHTTKFVRGILCNRCNTVLGLCKDDDKLLLNHAGYLKNAMADQQSAYEGLRELALFAGAGGGILGGQLLGWKTVCAVEIEPYAASVLLARQNDGLLPLFPIWDDICSFAGRPWRGIVDVVSGGFPCQDISVAGKGDGIEGEKSGLWKQMARIIREVRPPFVFVENSPALTNRGLGTVLGDLAAMGFNAKWGVLGARHAGAPHRRDRIWIVAAHPDRERRRSEQIGEPWCEDPPKSGNDGKAEHVADTISAGQSNSQGGCATAESPGNRTARTCGSRIGEQNNWPPEPAVCRVVDGLANRLDPVTTARLAALGNGQVPAVAKLAWELLQP